MLKRINDRLAKDSRLTWAVSLALLAAVSCCDYVTGIEYGFGLFYLLPTALLTWHVGRKSGLLLSAAAAAAWGLADYMPRLLQGLGPARLHITLWNTALGLGIYITFVLALSKLKSALLQEREMLRLKTDLLSVVSHEFNNSLTSMGMALLLLRENDESPEQRRRLYPVLERIHRIFKTTVANFLNQARMQSGRLQLDIKRIELRRLVAEVLELMRPLADQKEISLRLDFPESVIPANADPDAVVLVLSNLIGNAIKYTPQHGQVTVSLKPIGDGAAREVQVCVEDTGIGIASEDQEEVFSGFYRTQEGKKQAKGYGLGLMVSRQVLESHGSSLSLESQPGRGSRFTFKLPACPPDCPNRDAGVCHRCRRRNPLSEGETAKASL
jgi:signal transduction histidine kinase